MPSFINLLANHVWSDADITNRCRATIESQVPTARQDELRTIMLGHLAQMRAATDAEMAEIMLVKQLTIDAADLGRAARADMALLQSALDYEAAQARLLLQVVTEPATITVTDMDGVATESPNPAIAQDAAERDAAQALIDGASQDTMALLLLRHPPVVEVDPLVEAAP